MNKFPPIVRVRKSGEYARLKTTGRKVHTPGFLFLVGPAADASRLGVTVSSRVGNSVRRHRLKRLIKEVFRLHSDLFPKADVVVIAKTGCVSDSFDEVLAEVGRAFKTKSS